MRVVAGSARGKKLLLVPGHGTRPILDRVKTSLFDILRPRITDMNMLDLFAGSGSVGIEALSQGAASCTFIDCGHKAVSTIKRNLATTGFADRADVQHRDAFEYLRGTQRSFDLIYVAPPQYKNLWVKAMHQVAGRPELLRRPPPGSGEYPASGLAIVQIDPKEYESLDLGEVRETRQKSYGKSLLVFFELGSGPASDSQSGDSRDVATRPGVPLADAPLDPHLADPLVLPIDAPT
jgi:16S rRNA (guanine(966)-N(2))-methyltransferase RsmD